MQNKIKHLEMILGIVQRLNSNSFSIKGWAMGLVTALFAFASKEQNKLITLINLVVIIAAWLIDGYFISTERQFRALYEEVCKETDDDKITFSIKRSKAIQEEHNWLRGIYSITLLPFYGVLLAAAITVLYFF